MASSESGRRQAIMDKVGHGGSDDGLADGFFFCETPQPTSGSRYQELSLLGHLLLFCEGERLLHHLDSFLRDAAARFRQQVSGIVSFGAFAVVLRRREIVASS